MDKPIKFIYYIKNKFNIINNNFIFLKNDLDNYKIENNTLTSTLASDCKYIKMDYDILKTDFNNLTLELRTLKNTHNRLIEDLIQSQNLVVDCQSTKHNQEWKENQYIKLNRLNFLSNKLCNFLEIDSGCKMSLADVMKIIFSYIETNKLRNVLDKKIINPDKKLADLLNINKKATIVTYANIQHYIEPMLKPVKEYSLTI